MPKIWLYISSSFSFSFLSLSFHFPLSISLLRLLIRVKRIEHYCIEHAVHPKLTLAIDHKQLQRGDDVTRKQHHCPAIRWPHYNLESIMREGRKNRRKKKETER